MAARLSWGQEVSHHVLYIGWLSSVHTPTVRLTVDSDLNCGALFAWILCLVACDSILAYSSGNACSLSLGGACVASVSFGICQICWTRLPSVGVGGWGFLVR